DRRQRQMCLRYRPLTESLENTIARVRPCWEELIVPALNLYNCVLIAAHGNSLRALVMMLNKLTPEQIVAEEIPTGAPRVFTLTDRLQVVDDKYL
ncbi:MAG: 2,3-bisphosphoglycerate-dependent phosphoglycerate mutase, partial [Duncaniella sp.]|nr:2,3-bisphosphoglycerate-dependent phosphoglycerate mutase [Duncaniella sp.]